MKRTISLLSTLAFVLAFSGSVFAQTINASSEVLADLSVAEEQGINFGIVAQDFATNPTLDPSDASTSGSFEDASGAKVGLVSVSGTAGQTVDVTVATSITLTDDGGSGDQMTLTPSYNWTYDNLTAGNAPTNPVISNTSTDFSMTLDGASQNDDGQNTILIGGSMSETSTPDLTAGVYSGTGSITVSYN